MDLLTNCWSWLPATLAKAALGGSQGCKWGGSWIGFMHNKYRKGFHRCSGMKSGLRAVEVQGKAAVL